MKLSELLADIEVEKIIGAEQLNVTGIAFNSMEVRPGNIFVCITGFKTDGHKYAADAIDRGAIAVIAERDISELGVTCKRIERFISDILRKRPKRRKCNTGNTN